MTTALSFRRPYKSYYLVQSGQNTFTLVEGTSNAIITIPVGNYSRSSFQIQLQSLLNSSSPHSWTYAISIPNTLITGDTGLYTYTVTGNSSQPQFIIGSYLYEQLGFNANTTYMFSSGTLTSVNVVKFQLRTPYSFTQILQIMVLTTYYRRS